jgi:ATP-binding cassette subfamily B protein
MPPKNTTKKGNLFGLLGPYKWLIMTLILFTILANGLNLLVPKIMGTAIDTFTKGSFVLERISIEFSVISLLIFLFTYQACEENFHARLCVY